MEPNRTCLPLDSGEGAPLLAETVPRLAELLRLPNSGTEDPSWEMRTRDQRLAAVRALASTGHPDAIAPLCQALGDLSFPVRQAAAEALFELADQCPGRELRRAVPLLRNRSAHRRSELPAVQRKCRQALERIEAVTASFKDLPLPVTASGACEKTLPVAVHSPEGSGYGLPLAADADRNALPPGAARPVGWTLRLLAYLWPGMLG